MKSTVPIATTVLIAICAWLAIQSDFGSAPIQFRALFISVYLEGLPEIRDGQWWRLITPIFLHFGIAHLVFNTLWLWQLGGAMERRQSPADLIIFVLVIGAASNLAQYWVSGPRFGGMSGVVYGLLGYFWMQGRYNPRFGMSLDKTIVIMMLVWFVICWLGIIGNVANTAHGIGLLAGMAWGYVAARMGRPA